MVREAQFNEDPRTQDWVLMDLKVCLLIMVAYVGFVLLLKKLDDFIPQLELYYARLLHNLTLTLLSGYMVLEILRQLILTRNIGGILPGEQGLGMAAVLWVFYASKILEFGDTFIMIFRKKWEQVSFLHVYHHASVFLIWWFNVLYYPGGEAFFPALFNSFVHVLMYSYYLLSTFKLEMPWKKYLTSLQISQLFSFVLQGIWLIFTGPRESRLFALFNGGYALSLFLLFVQFYNQSYRKPKDQPANGRPKNGTKPRKDE